MYRILLENITLCLIKEIIVVITSVNCKNLGLLNARL